MYTVYFGYIAIVILLAPHIIYTEIAQKHP